MLDSTQKAAVLPSPFQQAARFKILQARATTEEADSSIENAPPQRRKDD
eukprot:CAMPEP_0177783890 /NCGR_PEP_ID=MMETSP0491_2-20121128/19370_1 /TAXON_ID=63592 /ORGANISM="Tetraselmis chuii, Strain PLY429" /LENGTH=48 /DNA_ID= /DNA_START= /DNA_END= /DNA_ORIENTATION=